MMEVLKEKFKKLFEESKKATEKGTLKFLKPPVLNLTNHELPKHHLDLLNLGPKFVPTTRDLPFMDIVTSTEICALGLERDQKVEIAESLRQKVNDILLKNINFKPIN